MINENQDLVVYNFYKISLVFLTVFALNFTARAYEIEGKKFGNSQNSENMADIITEMDQFQEYIYLNLLIYYI